MHQGNWTCSGCGAAINELPFEPRSTEGLLCRQCHQKQREERKEKTSGERQMYQGEWPCSTCDQTIKELPFEPRSTENLKCRDCFMNSK